MRQDRYELKDRIGTGGHGEVFRAELVGTEEFARPVAIKRIRQQLSADENFAKDFITEAHILSKLRHPNIVDVFDFYHDGAGRLCLVMELVEGVSLSELIKSGPLPLTVVVYIITEVLRGLAHAHGAPFKFVHRDVTPRNILVAWNGAVKLSDFGLAKAQAQTGTLAMKGTPGYISPEHVQHLPLDGRADLFAVGVILYELLTGRRLFQAKGQGALIMKLLTEVVEPPRNIRPEIPEPLDAITMRLLARDREYRYASAQVVIDDLLDWEHATPRARDELVTLLDERFPSAGRHASSEPVLGNAPTRRDFNALVQQQILATQLAGAARRRETNARVQEERLARQRNGEPSQVTQEERSEPPDQEKQLEPAPGMEAEAKRRRRAWLAALAVGVAMAAAVLLWPASNSTRHEPSAVENAPAAEADRAPDTERHTENVIYDHETTVRTVDALDEPTVPSVESARPRKRATDNSWQRASARNARGSVSWRP